MLLLHISIHLSGFDQCNEIPQNQIRFPSPYSRIASEAETRALSTQNGVLTCVPYRCQSIGSHIRWEGVRLGKKCSPSTNKAILLVGFAFSKLSIVFFVMMVKHFKHFANCLVGLEHVRGRVWGNCFQFDQMVNFSPLQGEMGDCIAPMIKYRSTAEFAKSNLTCCTKSGPYIAKTKKCRSFTKPYFRLCIQRRKKFIGCFPQIILLSALRTIHIEDT